MTITTSETYENVSPQLLQIIEEAYDRIGIISSLLDQNKVRVAKRSLNFILQSWINRGLNLWQVRQGMIELNAGQSSYTLSGNQTTNQIPAIDILEATIRTTQRNLGGTAFSSSGVAQNAFDGNSATACTENAPNGSIGYNWGATSFATTMVGIQSNATLDYTLSFSYSNDGTNYFEVYNYPKQQYNIGEIIWVIIPAPVAAPYFRVSETGGATLNIQELYFNTTLSDLIVTRLSRPGYVAFQNKTVLSRPTSFYVDRQIVPTLYLYPTPSSQYSNFYYTYISPSQDIGNMTNMAEVPSRFLGALTAELAHILSLKQPEMDTNRVNILREFADKEFALAAQEDAERVPLRIYGDYMQGWTQS